MTGVLDFRLLAYRVEVRFEDESLAPLLASLLVTHDQPREPVARMRYRITGDGPYGVLEEGDRLTSGLTARAAVATLAERSRARLIDHLALGGWVAARGGVASIDGVRVLVLGRPNAMQRMSDVEGDELVFFRAGEVVCLPQASSRRVRLGPVHRVLIAGEDGGSTTPVGTGEAVRMLLAATVTPWQSAGSLIADCAALVGHAEVFRLQ